MYLKQNFAYNGEAYMKGAGHLLREDFWKAIIFLTVRHLLVSSSCFFLLFGLVGKEGRRQFYKMLLYIAIAVVFLTVGYSLYQVINMATEGYDRQERIIEIALTWLLRVGGFLIGYKLAMTVFEQSSQKKYVS
ncbi:MAG: hypothetical protein EOO10_19530 [Chitinophagaceae bacterium]|nr:MAG: hypothetical protein EOO10_19530 [Chitinophagaceae bacterium]